MNLSRHLPLAVPRLSILCMALFLALSGIASAATGTGTTSHTGPAPANHMRQGGTGTLTFSLFNNGPGSTSGTLTVTITLPTGLTPGTLPTGTPWNCTAVSQTLTCTNSSAIAQGSSYQPLIIPVNVATNAASSVTVSGATFSGAEMTTGVFSSDTITIDPAPILALAKSHTGTFTQGSTATWKLTVSNNSGSASGATDGSTVTVVDTLPAGYTLASGSGTNWSIAGTQTVTCTTSAVVAGGGSAFPVITLTVNVPADSAVSVTNNAKAFGGGDVTHTNSGNGAAGSETVAVVQAPATIGLTAGNNQSAAVNTAFATKFSATVFDAGNVPISGVIVTFTAPGSGASGKFTNLSTTTTATTNASGVATATTYTANAIAGGPYPVNVTASSVANNFVVTNLAGAATQMAANAGTTPQSAPANTAFATPLGVTVRDAVNNPVSGVTVTFTAPGAGASGTFPGPVTTVGVVTNGFGIATAPALTANGTVGGPYNVIATAAGLTAVNFALTNSGVGPVITTNPVSQSAVAGSNVNFTAAANGNPTPTVQWQVSTDNGGTFSNIAGATATTLSLTAVVASANVNQYHAVFTNAAGGATTTAATLTVSADVTQVERLGDGSIRLTFAGVPGRLYRVQSTGSLAPVNWLDRGTGTADSLGKFQFTDPPPLPAMRFYHSIFP